MKYKTKIYILIILAILSYIFSSTNLIYFGVIFFALFTTFGAFTLMTLIPKKEEKK